MKQPPRISTILIAYSAFVILGLYDGLLGVAWPGLRVGFGLPVDALGTLLVLSTGGYIFAGIVNGRLSNRLGIAALLLLSAGLSASGRAAQAASSGWLWLLLFTPVAGMGMGLLDSGMNTFAAARFRPRLLNWLHASFGVGTTLGSLFMTALIARELTWRAGFGTVAGLNAVLLIIFYVTRPRWRLSDHEEWDQVLGGSPSLSNLDTLRLPQVWLSVALFFLYVGLEIGLGHWAFTLLTSSRAVDPTTAGLWVTGYWGSFTGGRLILGFVETNQTRLLRRALGVLIAGVALIALNLGPLPSLFGLILAGVGSAPVFPALIAQTPARVGLAHAPNAIGLQVAAAGLGAALLPAAAGWLGDALGLEWIVWFLLVCGLLEVAFHEWLVRLTPHQGN